MSKATFTTNADEVYNAFLSFSTKEMKSALKSGLRKALVKVRNEARKNLKSDYPNAAKNNSGKWDNSLVNDIRLPKKWCYEDNGVISGIVRADSKRTKGSGSFRLKFFEIGTIVRKTRKGYNRGSIKASQFLQRAKISSEGYFNSTMKEAFSKAVMRINNKKWKK